LKREGVKVEFGSSDSFVVSRKNVGEVEMERKLSLASPCLIKRLGSNLFLLEAGPHAAKLDTNVRVNGDPIGNSSWILMNGDVIEFGEVANENFALRFVARDGHTWLGPSLNHMMRCREASAELEFAGN
jgi:hypothetical protein